MPAGSALTDLTATFTRQNCALIAAERIAGQDFRLRELTAQIVEGAAGERLRQQVAEAVSLEQIFVLLPELDALVVPGVHRRRTGVTWRIIPSKRRYRHLEPQASVSVRKRDFAAQSHRLIVATRGCPVNPQTG